MATATGLTKDRMLAIEAASVVDGEVVVDNLILQRHDGTTIDAGNVRGPEGSGGGVTPYERHFASALSVWDFPHNLGTKALSVYTENASGKQIEGLVEYVDDDNIRVTYFHSQTGFGRVF